jgi:hypothetical protein
MAQQLYGLSRTGLSSRNLTAAKLAFEKLDKSSLITAHSTSPGGNNSASKSWKEFDLLQVVRRPYASQPIDRKFLFFLRSSHVFASI